MKRYFGSLSFYRQALLIGVTVMLQSLIQSLVSLVDNFMVAELGDVKMSGVSIAGQILFVFMVLSNAICAAGGIYMTQFSGTKDRTGMRQALRFKFYLIGSFIALYLLVCFALPRQILSLMVIGNAYAEAILDAGVEYMRLMGFMGVPFCISIVLATSMREIGQVRVPLVISVIGTLVNTGLNWVLIYGNLGVPRLEVRGAAYATLIARFIEMTLYVIYVLRNPQPFMGRREEKVPTNWKLFGSILRRGWLMLFSEVLWVVSETVTTAVYNGRGGADVVSGIATRYTGAILTNEERNAVKRALKLRGVDMRAAEMDKEYNHRAGEWVFSNEGTMLFGDCLRVDYTVDEKTKDITFGKASSRADTGNREMNATLLEMDKATLSAQITRDNDAALTDRALSVFSAAQIVGLLNLAIDHKATRCTARLLDYKNTHFPEFAEVNEFSLDW